MNKVVVVQKRNRVIASLVCLLFVVLSIATGASYLADGYLGGLAFYVVFGGLSLWSLYRSLVGYAVRIDAEGVSVARSFRTHRFPWSQIGRVGKARATAGFVSRVALWLEADGGKVVFSEFNQSHRNASGPVDQAIELIDTARREIDGPPAC